MNRRIRGWLCGTTLIAAAAAAALAAGTAPNLSYPAAQRSNHIDTYHGTHVADPYRWLENIDSPQTRAWVEAEGKLSSDYLHAIPGRQSIVERLTQIWNFERWSAPEHAGSTWLYSHNNGLQNQSVVMAAADPAAPARVLLDPNTLIKDGTVALRELVASRDGKLVAYAMSDAGSDWQIWRVRDVASGKDTPDEVHWSKDGSATWRHDGSGFYYARFGEPKSGQALKEANVYEKLYFHQLGTPQSADTLVYERTDDPNWYVGAQVSDDGHYLVVFANHGDEVQNTLLVQDLTTPGAPIVPIISEPKAVYTFVGNVGSTLYIESDDGAPHYRVIAIDLAHPQPTDWRTVVPETSDTIDTVTMVGGQIIVQYLKDAHSAVRRFAPDGTLLGEVKLEGFGTAGGFAGHPEDTTTFYTYSSFTTPPSVYQLDLKSGTSTLWRQPQLKGFTPSDFQTQQIFYRSKDGTRVPMFITARKGAKLDGSNPTILYGYGGFNISMEPGFAPAIATWLGLGGVWAMPNLRGGGEYGRAWHEAGMKTHKQNVFDDFIAAAEYLIAEHWTNPKRLAIRGGSNGGLLVGATEEQRPELFAAAVPEVGVMDMLRFREFTVGKGWESDYGSVDNPEEFRALHAYSPLHNVKSGANYPPTLIVTSDHDDRVFPAHSFKFAAAMQHADPAGNPILLRVETRAGHGQGMPTTKRIEENADFDAFILNAMGLAH